MDQLLILLKKLKDNGCSGIKISFEDEGAQYNEIATMRYLTAKTGLELSIKIGGCEAKRDIVDCIQLSCDTIVAPMIESGFALYKFTKSLESCACKTKRSFNLETIDGFSRIDDIMSRCQSMNSITFGRVDYVSSMNRARDYIDSPDIYNIIYSTFLKAKSHNPPLLCNMGGAVSLKSKDFIRNLIEAQLLDYFETRYIIFKTDRINMENYEDILHLANLFEIEWLRFIRDRYSLYAGKDVSRIDMIEQRMNNSNVK
jgi:hypothetical protein